MKIYLSTTHSDGSIILYSAKVVKACGEYAQPDQTWVEIPARVRALRFPPYGGRRYVAFKTSGIAARLALA